MRGPLPSHRGKQIFNEPWLLKGIVDESVVTLYSNRIQISVWKITVIAELSS